jgi:hypothetical protein
VVEKLPEAKPLASHFVFKLKLDADGVIERYRVRLFARGDKQAESVSYQDTFSSVMDMTTARIIFVFGVIWGSPLSMGHTSGLHTRVI